MRILSLLLLTACTAESIPFDGSPLATTHSLAPPTAPSFTLDAGPICPGATTTLSVVDAPPNSDITVVLGRTLGGGPCLGSLCAAVGPTLQSLATLRTDGSGDGTLMLPVPDTTSPGGDGWLQAADLASRQVSNPTYVRALDPADPDCSTRGPARSWQFAWGGNATSDPAGMPGTSRFEPDQLDALFAHTDMQVIPGFHGGWELDDAWRDAVNLRALEGIDLQTTALSSVPTERTMCFYINSSYVIAGTRNREPWLSSFDPAWLLTDDAGNVVGARNSTNEHGDLRQVAYRDFLLDIARRYLLPFDDPEDGLGNPVHSPFNCVSLDSHNHIGGADPITSPLDWEYWHSEIDWASPDTVIDDYNAGLDQLRADLSQVGRNETGLGDGFTLMFNGFAHKDFRVDRNLAFFDHADAGLTEDFCVDYQTLARWEERLAAGAPAEDKFCATRGYRGKDLVLEDWALMDATDAGDPTAEFSGRQMLWQANYRLDDEPTNSCAGEVNDGPALPTYADQVSFCQAEFLMGYRPSEHWFGNGRYRLGSLAYRAWAVIETLHDADSTPDLGAPLGRRTEPMPGLFKREFERGEIYVNFDAPRVFTYDPGLSARGASRASYGGGQASLERYGALILTR